MKEVKNMLEGQLKFLDFFLNNTIEGKEEQAKEILVKSFADQETNALSLEEFKQLQEKSPSKFRSFSKFRNSTKKLKGRFPSLLVFFVLFVT